MESDNILVKIKEEIIDVEFNENEQSYRAEFELHDAESTAIDISEICGVAIAETFADAKTGDGDDMGFPTAMVDVSFNDTEDISSEINGANNFNDNTGVPTPESVLERVLRNPLADRKKNKNIIKKIGKSELRCEICNMTFSRFSRLKDHVLSHTDLRPYVCNHCDKTFKQSSSLNFHLKTHFGNKPFACELCGKAFVRKYLLLEHMITHDDDRPYPCDHCNKPFKTKRSLASHLRSLAVGRAFPCDHCDKIFSTKYNLKMHIKLLAGERPFECEYCPKKFKLRNHLKAHLRLHSNEHPFKCVRCGRGFQFFDHLKAHLRWHTLLFKKNTGRIPPEELDFTSEDFINEEEVSPVEQDS